MTELKTATTFSLRPATIDDLDAILEIERLAYPLPWTRQQFVDEVENPRSHFLVYTDDETDTYVAGYIVFWDLEHETHILNVAVNLDWRGLGMGLKLVGAAINHSYRCNHDRVFLEVRASNSGAISLYQKVGFQVDHVKKSFYENKEDAVFMVLRVVKDVAEE